MKTLRIISLAIALLVCSVIVAHRARAVIIFGTQYKTGHTETPTNGVFSSNNVSFTVTAVSGKALIDLTVITNYFPGLVTNMVPSIQWISYNFFVSSNGIDYTEVAGQGQSMADANNHITWWRDLAPYPEWWIIQAVDGCCPNYINPTVLGYYGTNVIGQTEVTPKGILAQQMFGMSQNGNTIPTGSAADTNGNIYTCGYWSGQATFGAVVTNTPVPNQTCGFLVKYNSAGAVQWFKSFVGTNFSNTGNTACKAVEVDSAGNIIVVGNFQNSVDFGAGAVAASSAIDAFVAKYDPAGGLGWVQHYGNNTTFDVGKTVAIDSTNGIYIVQDAVVGANIGFSLKKLSTTLGATVWSTNHAGSGWAAAKGIAVDTNNCPIVCGSVQGTSIDLGGGTLTASGSYNIMLAKYSATDGAYQWGKLMGTSGGNQGYAVETDTNGNVILTGLVQSANLGGGTVGSAGSIYIAGYNPSGTWLWNRLTGTGSDSGSALAVSGNNLTVVGRCASVIWFPGMELSLLGNGQVDFWVASFTLSGTNAPTHSWSKLVGYGLDGASVGNGVCFDSSGRVVPVGSFMATVDFGLGNVTATGVGYSSGFTLRYGN